MSIAILALIISNIILVTILHYQKYYYKEQIKKIKKQRQFPIDEYNKLVVKGIEFQKYLNNIISLPNTPVNEKIIATAIKIKEQYNIIARQDGNK